MAEACAGDPTANHLHNWGCPRSVSGIRLCRLHTPQCQPLKMLQPSSCCYLLSFVLLLNGGVLLLLPCCWCCSAALLPSPLQDAFRNGAREKLIYVPCIVPDQSRPDYLATVDVDPDSSTYSQVCDTAAPAAAPAAAA
jgi:hypothetical protein